MIEVVKTSEYPQSFYVGRPSKFGNPYSVIDYGHDEAIIRFAIYWYADGQKDLRREALSRIPKDGKLGCYCAPRSCHGDIIAGYVNWRRND